MPIEEADGAAGAAAGTGGTAAGSAGGGARAVTGAAADGAARVRHVASATSGAGDDAPRPIARMARCRTTPVALALAFTIRRNLLLS